MMLPKIPGNRKTKLIIASTAILILIAILLLLPKKKSEPQTSPTPVGSSQSTNLPSSIQEFQLVSITPEPPYYKSIWPEERITLRFNQAINPNSISYKVSPQTKTKTIFDPAESQYEFSIIPIEDIWEASQPYTITLSKQLSSTSNEQLPQDITFTITRNMPSQEELKPLLEKL